MIMDFETFKKDFELFTKIDTPEMLTICESQYRKHLLSLEDEKYFEPEVILEGNDINSRYSRDIRHILNTDIIKENEFSVVVLPSFEPEYALTITKDIDAFILTYKKLESSYWVKLYSNQDKIIVIETIQINLSNAIGEKLFNLLKLTMSEARNPSGSVITLDGVKYYLSQKIDNGINTVTKHSPNINSRSGKIISLFTSLINYTKSSSTKDLEAISGYIDNLER